MITHVDELELAFTRICDDEVWQGNLNDTLRNECLNFAHRVLAYTLENGGLEQQTKALLEMFRTFNSLQGK